MIMFCPKVKSDVVIKKGNFNPQLQPFPLLKQDFKWKRPFLYICYLGVLSTCFRHWPIPVSVQGKYWWIFGRGWANWFKLVSAQPNIQPKIKAIVTDFKFVEGSSICEVRVAKVQLHNLENPNMPRFSCL